MMSIDNSDYNRKVLNNKYLGRFKKREYKEGEAKPRNKFHRGGGSTEVYDYVLDIKNLDTKTIDLFLNGRITNIKTIIIASDETQGRT